MFVQLWPLIIHSVLVYVLAHIMVDQWSACSILDLLAETKEEYHARCYIMFFCCSDCLQGVVWKTEGYSRLVVIILAL